MLGQQFYHESIRNVIVAFGTMFNNIQIVRKNNSGAVVQAMKVPLAYGPKQKFLTRLRSRPFCYRLQQQLLYQDLVLKLEVLPMILFVK